MSAVAINKQQTDNDQSAPHSFNQAAKNASIWDINPFDQWGVEMGKKMAESVHTAMQQGGDEQFDTSTNQLLQHIKLLS